MQKKSYVCVGGYGLQYWGGIYKPDIAGNCNGLSICVLDHETGKITLHSSLEGISNPGTLVVSPDKKYIYCADEEHDFGGMGRGGGVTACSFDAATGTAKLINQSLAYGSSSCYVNIDKTGKYLLVANHGTKFYVTRFVEQDGELQPVCVHDQGCVCLFAIREDGGVGKLLDRLVLDGTGAHPVEHASAHPHSVLIDDQDFIVIPNKGGDSITVAKLNRETEKMDVLSVYKSDFGTSPRHAMFVPGTDFVLGTNEFGGQVTSYSLNRETGELTRISLMQTYDQAYPSVSFMIVEKEKPWAIDVQLHPNGKFVYADNVQGLILLYYLDRETGELTHVRNVHVDDVPMLRGLQISPDGDYLIATTVAGEKILVYRIDPETGFLTETSQLTLPTPTATRFVDVVEG
ncbi:MAG TPA: beta-propeller fold lactonase family protein [Candidatus Faecousia intestinigallinarum]|nr:beta-propeller fold lactonase family protein [Candidatus Faecousia intestinigallinarum]